MCITCFRHKTLNYSEAKILFTKDVKIVTFHDLQPIFIL